VGRTFTLFTYKLRFFFGPALRGRFGPLAYLALILIFLPSGFRLRRHPRDHGEGRRPDRGD